ESLIAPSRQLRKRNRISWPSAGAIDPLTAGTPAAHLGIRQNGQISRMKNVTGLLPGAVKADKTQRAAPRVRVNQIRKDPLIGGAELSRTRQDAAAIDPDGELEGIAVFQRQRFGRQLSASVQ